MTMYSWPVREEKVMWPALNTSIIISVQHNCAKNQMIKRQMQQHQQQSQQHVLSFGYSRKYRDPLTIVISPQEKTEGDSYDQENKNNRKTTKQQSELHSHMKDNHRKDGLLELFFLIKPAQSI